MGRTKDLNYFRHITIHLWGTQPEIRKVANKLYLDFIKDNETNHSEGTVKNHFKIILVNLLKCSKQDSYLYLSYSLNRNDYFGDGFMAKMKVKFDLFKLCINFMINQKLIENHSGLRGDYKNYLPRMKATKKLTRLFRKWHTGKGRFKYIEVPVIIKDNSKPKKKAIKFNEDEPEIKQIIKDVKTINRFNRQHVVTLNISASEIRSLKNENKITSLDFDRVNLTREFNNKSIKFGGRFYGHFVQGLPKDIRKKVLIDSRPTIELDYSALHPTMLYGLANLQVPSKDMYDMVGYNHELRPLIKQAFMIVINASDSKSAVQAINMARREFIKTNPNIFVPKPKEIRDNIILAHSSLSKFFCTGIGIELQRIDSDMANDILLDCVSKDVPCIPIHDSFIVKIEHQNILYESMQINFLNRFSFFPVIK